MSSVAEERSIQEKVQHARNYLKKVQSVEGRNGSDACVCACSALFDSNRIGFTAEEEDEAWAVLVEWNRSGNVKPPWDETREFDSDSLRKKFDEAMAAYTGGACSSNGCTPYRNGSHPLMDQALQGAVLTSPSTTLDEFLQKKPTQLIADEIIKLVFPDDCWPEDMTAMEEEAARMQWERYKGQNAQRDLQEPVWRPQMGRPVAPLLTGGWNTDYFHTARRDHLPWPELTFLAPSPCRSFMGQRQNTDGTHLKDYTAHSKAQMGPRYITIAEWDRKPSGERYSQAEQIILGTYLMKFAPLLWVVWSASRSGEGSLHWAWFCRDLKEDKIRDFFDHACAIGADSRLWQAFQFTRVPNGINSKTGQQQRCIYFNPDLIGLSSTALHALWLPVPVLNNKRDAEPENHDNDKVEKPSPDDRIIILPSAHVGISKSAEELFRLIGPTRTLFNRGGTVVELAHKEDGLALEVLRPERARSTFENHGKLYVNRVGAHGGAVLKPTICPEETAKALLQTDAARTHLPTITGLLNCPIMVASGTTSRIIGRGYDAGTGLLITGGEMPPEVELSEAVIALKSLTEDFDFQTPADRSRALALFITPALRFGQHLAGNLPIDIAEADQSQSGKTFRQRLVAAIYNEKSKIITQKKDGVGSVDEAFNNALIGGRPFLQFDNFRGHIDSKHLEAFLTAENNFAVRTPHSKYVDVDPTRFFIQLSSNGVETTRDLANRSCFVRNRKRTAYSFKEFPEGDLLDHIRYNQPYYLGCVFAVARHWLSCGKPRTKDARHDFRQWCQTLDWIVQNIFSEAPLMDGHLAAQARVSNPVLTFLRKVALEVEQDRQLGVELMANELYKLAEQSGIEIPNLRTQNETSAIQMVGRIMSKVFEESDKTEVEGFIITRSVQKQYRKDSGSYTPKLYVFTKR
jgi:hypothetical protein